MSLTEWPIAGRRDGSSVGRPRSRWRRSAAGSGGSRVGPGPRIGAVGDGCDDSNTAPPEEGGENDGAPVGDVTGGPSEEALASSIRDRQILVVGRTVAGLAVATLLERGGYDPVVLGNGEPPRGSRVSVLWPSSVDVLDRIGVDAAALGRGLTVDSATLYAAGERVLTAGGDRDDGPPKSCVVPTGRLRERLIEAAPGEPVRRDVAGIEARNGSLEVTFDDGVREWFDAVVAADGPASSVRSGRTDRGDPPRLGQFEAVIRAAGRDRVVDAWTGRGLVQLYPHPHDGVELVRLTTAGPGGADPRRVRRELTAVESGPLAEVEPDALSDGRFTRVPQAAKTDWEWGRGRVAYCGASALPLAPATGLRTVLALEDAWVLADELVRGSRSVPDATRTYTNRRERRIDRLLERSDGTGIETDSVTPDLAVLKQFRAVALGRFGHDSPERQDPVPDG